VRLDGFFIGGFSRVPTVTQEGFLDMIPTDWTSRQSEIAGVLFRAASAGLAFALVCMFATSNSLAIAQPPAGSSSSNAALGNTLPNTTSANSPPNFPATIDANGVPGAATNPGIAIAPSTPSVPSIEGASSTAGGTLPGAKVQPKLELPNTSGQYWVEYDIRPYAQALKNVDRPQQAIIDWILRETGSDVWFNEPMGILSADRSTLRVYHNAGMHQVVAQIYERFVNGNNDPHVYGLRLISISNPNWRSKAVPLMISTSTKTPGAQAWLMSKENAAIFFSQLRQRQDAREIQAADLNMVHGQSQTLEQLRSRNYLKEYIPNASAPWPPMTPSYGEIQEGYRMVFSPLLSLDGRSMDLMLKCDIDQVEKLNTVPISTPNPAVNLQVEVPQFVSWRMNERFRWSTDQVLVLSCGIVAAPTANLENTLLTGGAPNLFGLNRVLPNLSSQRNDALLIVEYKGSANSQLNAPVAVRPNSAPIPSANGPAVPATANGSLGVSRGRY